MSISTVMIRTPFGSGDKTPGHWVIGNGHPLPTPTTIELKFEEKNKEKPNETYRLRTYRS
jgi:hypothetical protein